jgi:hypothetical protein
LRANRHSLMSLLAKSIHVVATGRFTTLAVRQDGSFGVCARTRQSR